VLDAFREVVVADFEFIATTGNRPVPVCLVAHELRSGRHLRIWQDQFGSAPPYATGPDVLFVAFFASAELGCYRVLGWPMPERILDPFIEFRARTNGLDIPAGKGLLGALAYFGLDAMGATEKTEMRELVLRGGPWSEDERTAILDYCEGDVGALERLLPAMLPKVDLPRALLRGRYMAAVAAMEHAGTPIDTPMLELFRPNWENIQDQLIAEIDANYGVYDGRTFKADRFAALLAARDIPWPLLESGHLDLKDDTFRQQARAYPFVSPLRELRSSLCDLRLNDLAVGQDGRNRTLLSPFSSYGCAG
jgi:DNA polymerase I